MRAHWLVLTLFAVGGVAQGETITADALVDDARAATTEVDREGLEDMIANEPDHVLIDVRSHQEIELGGGQIRSHLTLNIPRGELEFRIPGEVSDLDTPIVVYSDENRRSALAAQTLQRMGYTNVHNYAGGFPRMEGGRWPPVCARQGAGFLPLRHAAGGD